MDKHIIQHHYKKGEVVRTTITISKEAREWIKANRVNLSATVDAYILTLKYEQQQKGNK